MILTQEQEKVVGLSAGRHLVLAPPGSGKTEMLSQRILRALEAGVPPERMLCATFTNRAAFEMRERMAAAADGRALPDVGNIHHFCHRFLLSVGRIHPGVHVLDEVEQADFVREVVEVLRLELKTGETADFKRTHGVAVMGLRQLAISSTFNLVNSDCRQQPRSRREATRAGRASSQEPSATLSGWLRSKTMSTRAQSA